MTDLPNVLTDTEVARLLKVKRITVQRMLRKGRIKGVKVGDFWRIPEMNVMNFLNGNGRAR